MSIAIKKLGNRAWNLRTTYGIGPVSSCFPDGRKRTAEQRKDSKWVQVKIKHLRPAFCVERTGTRFTSVCNRVRAKADVSCSQRIPGPRAKKIETWRMKSG